MMPPRSIFLLVTASVVAAACAMAHQTTNRESAVETTSGEIAIENLDQQIRQSHEDAGLVDLLLVRSRFLADYDALSRASDLAESRFTAGRDVLVRARARSAVHRFADALADVDMARRSGAKLDEAEALRASILVATGRAAEVIPMLEDNLRRHPGYASCGALANAYAALNRFQDADRAYAQALEHLDTSLPFPYAWIHFVRGLMWQDQAKDRKRAAVLYRRALEYLPEFAAARIHLAEIEIADGDTKSALLRLYGVARASQEPEALSLLGVLHLRMADSARGVAAISRARERYDSLLLRHSLAFADHAAEFYLGPGADARRASDLARLNLANRHTDRAVALMQRAAVASDRLREASILAEESR
jgi:tetratricopeptide (TPR) repeat protein